jgi:hypothetical protein
MAMDSRFEGVSTAAGSLHVISRSADTDLSDQVLSSCLVMVGPAYMTLYSCLCLAEMLDVLIEPGIEIQNFCQIPDYSLFREWLVQGRRSLIPRFLKRIACV